MAVDNIWYVWQTNVRYQAPMPLLCLSEFQRHWHDWKCSSWWLCGIIGHWPAILHLWAWSVKSRHWKISTTDFQMQLRCCAPSNYFALELPEGSVSWMTIRKPHLILFKGVQSINHPCLWEILYCCFIPVKIAEVSLLHFSWNTILERRW